MLSHDTLLRVWNKGRDMWFSLLLSVDLSHLSLFCEIIFHIAEERGILSTWCPEEHSFFRCCSLGFIDASGKMGGVATDSQR